MVLQLVTLLLCAAALIAYLEFVPKGRGTERGAVGWADLLPGAVPTAGFSAGSSANGGPPTIPTEPGGGGAMSTGFGGRFVQLGRRALAAYQGWQGSPVARFDVSVASQYDDQELAKMIAQYGAIPADSDIGQLAVAAGARTYRQRVRFADGSTHSVEVIQLGGRKGGADSPESRPRSRRKNLTGFRLGTASWVMRKLHAQQRLGKRLASLSAKLYPQKRRSAVPCKKR